MTHGENHAPIIITLYNNRMETDINLTLLIDIQFIIKS